jgi:hypothetical protein
MVKNDDEYSLPASRLGLYCMQYGLGTEKIDYFMELLEEENRLEWCCMQCNKNIDKDEFEVNKNIDKDVFECNVTLICTDTDVVICGNMIMDLYRQYGNKLKSALERHNENCPRKNSECYCKFISRLMDLKMTDIPNCVYATGYDSKSPMNYGRDYPKEFSIEAVLSEAQEIKETKKFDNELKLRLYLSCAQRFDRESIVKMLEKDEELFNNAGKGLWECRNGQRRIWTEILNRLA